MTWITKNGYLIIKDQNGISIRISVEPGLYNNVRKSIIQAMPVCPKDLEIKSLKDENERLMNNMRRGY